jgi:hypothetical protein
MKTKGPETGSSFARVDAAPGLKHGRGLWLPFQALRADQCDDTGMVPKLHVATIDVLPSVGNRRFIVGGIEGVRRVVNVAPTVHQVCAIRCHPLDRTPTPRSHFSALEDTGLS